MSQRGHGFVCVCGCGRKRGLQAHHVIYQQELRRVVVAEHAAARREGPPDIVREMSLSADRRNIVPIGPRCHAAHHRRSKPLPLEKLPDSVFEFAAEVLGERAHGWLRRRYVGDDARLDALREIEAA